MICVKRTPVIETLILIGLCGAAFEPHSAVAQSFSPDYAVREAFRRESLEVSDDKLRLIAPNLRTALADTCRDRDNSKVKFASVEIASMLGLNPATDRTVSDRVLRVIQSLPCDRPEPCESARCENYPGWEEYYRQTLALNSDGEFLSLVKQKGFSPVKISWEDIGRYENSVWGDRISDVGIWVRKYESDPSSAELALSVRRDDNFRDKVLMVPAAKIKVHLRTPSGTVERTLPERLAELGLTSKTRDTNVIVSNQFAIVPVPQRASALNPARAAFNFSIFPYGSTNFVITDVIEGSSDAIVGPGNHQLLFANVNGQRAPFTASRAEERPDLLKLEAELKSQGMDVDVQRYYLIQIPLRKDVPGISLSNMGTPPMRRYPLSMSATGDGLSVGGGPAKSKVMPAPMDDERGEALASAKEEAGLGKVAIGTGDVEGEYRVGSGYAGKRAEEPIRVTVVYFVTPHGKVTRADMENFSKAFEAWDSSAIWGGSFVTKES